MSANTEHADKLAHIGELLRDSYSATEELVTLDDLMQKLNAIPCSVDSKLTSTEVILDRLITNGQRTSEYYDQPSR